MAKKMKKKAKKLKRTKKTKKTRKAKRKGARKGKKAKTMKKKKAKKAKKKTKTRASKPIKKAAKVAPRKPAVRPISARRKLAVTHAAQAVTQRMVGKVVHYYDHLGVAIIDLQEPLRVGDMVMLKKGDRIIPQRVESMQINHAPVASAKRGDVIGLKVDHEAHEGTVVLPG